MGNDNQQYRIWDAQLKQWATKSTYNSRPAASRQADRLDLKYGAVKHIVKPVTPQK